MVNSHGTFENIGAATAYSNMIGLRGSRGSKSAAILGYINPRFSSVRHPSLQGSDPESVLVQYSRQQNIRQREEFDAAAARQFGRTAALNSSAASTNNLVRQQGSINSSSTLPSVLKTFPHLASDKDSLEAVGRQHSITS